MKTKHIQLYYENKLNKEAKKIKKEKKEEEKKQRIKIQKQTFQIDYSKVVRPKSMLKLGIFAC